jgi:hypothetical protein
MYRACLEDGACEPAHHLPYAEGSEIWSNDAQERCNLDHPISYDYPYGFDDHPMNCVDWDGPASALAEAMSAACGLPLRKLGAQPGSIGSYAGVDAGIPTVTLELPAAAARMTGEEVWRRYGPALLTAIRVPAAAK